MGGFGVRSTQVWERGLKEESELLLEDGPNTVRR